MTIAQYLRLLREQWITVLLLSLLGTVGAGVFSFLQTPTYAAKTQLFVSTSGGGDLQDLTQGSTFTQARVKSYTDLVTSPRVLQPVVDKLHLDTDVTSLAKQVTATSPLDTVLIDVTVTDTSPQRAADIANAVATTFPDLVSALEGSPGRTTSPVKVSITRQAVPPDGPVSPRKSLNLALGLLVGLGLGVGVAVLRDSLDRTLSSRSELTAIAGAPVLGAVPDDDDASDHPLIVHDAFSPRAEAFRQLRTNIRFLGVDHRVTSLVVTGSLQAEGKSSTAANLAIALAQSGERVALLDADLRRPSIADVFGLPSGVGLTSVLLGDVPWQQAAHVWHPDLPLRIVTSGPVPPNPSELIGSDRMAALIRELTAQGLTVVVDSPPLLPVTDAAVLARVTDGALLVGRAGSTRIEQFTAAVESLRTAGAPILGIVLNRLPKRGRSRYQSGEGYYYSSEGGYAPLQPVQSPHHRTATDVPATGPAAGSAAGSAIGSAGAPAVAPPSTPPAVATGPAHAVQATAGTLLPGRVHDSGTIDLRSAAPMIPAPAATHHPDPRSAVPASAYAASSSAHHPAQPGYDAYAAPFAGGTTNGHPYPLSPDPSHGATNGQVSGQVNGQVNGHVNGQVNGPDGPGRDGGDAQRRRRHGR